MAKVRRAKFRGAPGGIGEMAMTWFLPPRARPSPFHAATEIAFLLLAIVMVPHAWGSQNGATGQEDNGAIRLQTPSPAGPIAAGSADNLELLDPLENLIRQGQYQQVVPGLEHYLQDHDRSAEAHYDLGYVYFRTHEIGGAVRELSRSLELNDRNAQAHKILGLVCTFVGRYDISEAELRKAAQLEPGSAEIHYFLARIYYTRQVFPMAQKEFQTAIQLNPAYVKAYSNLGLVMEALGNNGEAVKDYTTAAQLDEKQHLGSPWPYEFLGAHYNRQRQPALAIEYAQKALAMDSRCDLAYYDLAKAFQTQNDWQKAADEVQKAIAINSSTPEYFYLLSIALRRLGKIPESEAALKKFEQIHKEQNTMAKLWRKASHQPYVPQTLPVPEDEP